MLACFECGAPAEHDHHVVPRALGGTKTVSLCGLCHARVHDAPGLVHSSSLTSQAMRGKQSRGEYVGGTPSIGMRRVAPGSRWVVPDEHEQRIIARVRELRALRMSLRDIARTIGPNPRSGRLYDPNQIARMLRNGR